MSEKKPLHYTNVKDLLQMAVINYKGKRPSDIYKRLPNMYNVAENAKKQGDEENQYIMLRRWLNCIEWLKNTQEYKDDKTFSLTNMNVNQINEAKKVLADLNRRLDVRYKLQLKEKMLEKSNSTEKMDVDNEAGTDTYMSSVDGPIKLPETPTRDPLVSDNEEIINCDQLFQLMQKVDNRYLIIDIRPKLEFDASRILSDNSVNIPNNIIKPGALTSHFEEYLRKDKKPLDLFRHRGARYVDVIILIDWDTSSKTLTSENHLNILRKILEDWDPGIKYKRITILDGGYAEWITRYPAFTTNPNIAEPSLNDVPNEVLDNIKYPDWIHLDEEENIIKLRENKSNKLKPVNLNEPTPKVNITNDKMWYKHMNSEMSNNISIHSNNLMNNSIEIEKVPKNNLNSRQYDNSLKLQHKRTLSIIKKSDIPVKPKVDRSSKPTTLDTSTSESKAVLKLMKQLNELAKNKQELEQEILEQEHTLYMQHGIKYKGTNEEEYINSNVKSLCLKLEEQQKEYKKFEDDLTKYYTKMESIKFNSAEEIEKRNLELTLASLKRRMKDTSADRKKLREKFMKNNYKELSTKENENDTHKEPLKTDNSSMGGNLERSYSSPNLLQLSDHKAPQVDRSSKPQISYNKNGTYTDNKMSHLSWANREERMTPVHGSVHPGITGLKNLGNSCYMNSIIQCLSNTTHLAKYFMDNLYADDLNNENNTQGQVVEEVAQVIKALWRGQYKSISPHDLKIAVGQYKLQFDSYEQQDSHEFLTFLLDWMHNDLKKNCKVPLEMTVAEKAWDKAMGSQRSIISDLFFGQLRSTITCSFCKQSSTTYETFNSLTTSLPHSNRCTLNDCILKFVSGQKVLGWKCPKCHTPREAMKKFDFVKLAPIIVIHLNRFAESGGWLEKRNTAVDFPLTDFNLKPYLVTDSNSTTISNIRSYSYSYSLYAMSNHYGTMEGGHYTAFCKNAAQNK
ncbi:Ubiquitin carboxyl-terminal hydrolase 8 [Eufriesea mexicana]|uniref:Ubiquitin carboxyl-terminal hydrolase n=3 Tax=Eufriesea mexicana TaxID=516756 RepID=A0A310SID1_9HYME|nr:Ubiquitin carboxyl-terminal hydrolase 8 [Eufriesea mexicana]